MAEFEVKNPPMQPGGLRWPLDGTACIECGELPGSPTWYAHANCTGANPEQSLITEIAALRIQPNERLIIHVDPSISLENAGYYEDLRRALADAGLGGRAIVIACPVTKIDFKVVESDAATGEPSGLSRVIQEK